MRRLSELKLWRCLNMQQNFFDRDTLFYKDFNVDVVIKRFCALKRTEPRASLVTVYECDKDGEIFLLLLMK